VRIEPLAVLADAAVRVTLMLATAWLVTLMMRRAAASTRHVVWASAFVCAALIPFLAIVAPQWQVQAPPAVTRLTPVLSVGSSTATSNPSMGVDPSSIAIDPAHGIAADADAAPDSRVSISTLVWGTWAIGTLMVVAYLILGIGAAWWFRRSVRPVDTQWVEDAHAVAEALGIRQRVVFAEASVATPMVSGLWRPCIMVPREASVWPRPRLEVALIHELAHVKRRDCATQLVAQLVCALYWFNPLVWIASRRLRAERERACDDFVLAVGARGSEYAGHLLEIAQGAQSRPSSFVLGGVAMARRSQLEGRVMAILDPAIRRSSALRTRMAAAAVLILASVPLAALHVKGPEPILHAPAAVPQGTSSPAVTAPPVPRVPPAQSRSPQSAAAPSNRDARIAREAIVEVALTRMLVEAAQRGNEEQIGSLLAAGADLNGAVQGDGNALIAAAQRGHLNVVQMLLNRGADVNAGVPGDGTPLIAAAQRGHLRIVTLLLERGADITLPFAGDGSPLIAAAQRGHLPIVELLLERGADIEQVVEGDENALIGASAGGHLPVVQLLVARGANVNARVWAERSWWGGDGGGNVGEWRTPLSMARRGGHAAVVSFLLSAGAQD
jgi:beta-lactamase regulating signal transducer with metallopeptidase domain